jgi:large repetitive protein
VEVTVTCAPDDPQAVDDSAEVFEGDTAAVTGNVLTNDTDADPGDTLTVATVNGGPVGTVTGTFGTLVIAANGAFGYTLDNANPVVAALAADEQIADSFTYQATDGTTDSNTATLTVTISGVNDLPVANDDTATITEDDADPVTGNVLSNDTDADATDVLTVDTVNGADTNVGVPVSGDFGTVEIAADGSYSYALDNSLAAVQALDDGEQLTDTFTYEATDGTAASNTATLTVTITGVNDPPVANDDTAAIAEDAVAAVTGNLLTNDTDAEDDTLTVDTVNGGPAGTVTGTFGTLVVAANGTFSYAVDNGNPAVQSLAAGETATDVFTYEAFDGTAISNEATLTVTITGVNDPVDAIDDTAAVFEGDVAAVTGNVLDNDVDVDATDVLTVDEVNGDANNVGISVAGEFGAVVIDADGGFGYTLDNSLTAVQELDDGEQLIDEFTYRATDGPTSDTATLTVTITGVEDPPVANDDTATVTEDDPPTTIPVLANDLDVDGDPFTIDTASDPANGVVVVAADGLSLTYQPDPDYCNDPPGDTLDTFTYSLTPAARRRPCR